VSEPALCGVGALGLLAGGSAPGSDSRLLLLALLLFLLGGLADQPFAMRCHQRGQRFQREKGCHSIQNDLPDFHVRYPIEPSPSGRGNDAMRSDCRYYTFTRSTYSPVRVSMRTTSPCSMKAGTWISVPVSTVAALVMFPEVFPRTAGSV